MTFYRFLNEITKTTDKRLCDDNKNYFPFYFRLISRRRSERRATLRRMSTVSVADDGDNNITLVMITVVLIFMITQAPARLVQVIWEYKYTRCYSLPFISIEISKIVEVLNSGVNFFIYCGLRPSFRSALKLEFCTKPVEVQSITYPMTNVPQIAASEKSDTKETLLNVK